MAIHDVVSRLTPSPILLTCAAAPADVAAAGAGGRLTAAYAAIDAAREDGSRAGTREFVTVPTEVGATEAEEVGVEHLLRDVRDGGGPGGGVHGARTPGGDAAALATGVAGLASRLTAAAAYADAVAAGTLPPNHDIIADLQSALNDAPSLSGGGGDAVAAALGARANDGALATYVGAAVRAVLALHALVDNREAAAAAAAAAASKGDAAKAADGDKGDKGAAVDGDKENTAVKKE